MTPSLLTSALRQWTGDMGAPYVFSFGNWSLEATKERNCLIATRRPRMASWTCFDTCQARGWNLVQHAEEVTEARELADGDPDAGKLN